MNCPECNRILYETAVWCHCGWKAPAKPAAPVNYARPYEGNAAHWEQKAREAARKFGVDENLSPRERCMAIAKAISARGGMGGGYRKRVAERLEAGEDWEEDAA